MNVIKWISDSNRWKHLLYGYAIGFGADDAYCAAYVGTGVASALEYKDKSWGGQWDWSDWSCTVVGVAFGFGTRILIKTLIK